MEMYCRCSREMLKLKWFYKSKREIDIHKDINIKVIIRQEEKKMKKTVAVILTLVLFVCGVAVPLKNYAAKASEVTTWRGGVDTTWYRDTSAKEYIITTPEELAGLAHLVNGGMTFAGQTVYLGEDIVLNEGDASTWGTNAPKNEWKPIGADGTAFQGIFDGQGHTISGVYISYDVESGSSSDNQGLFGTVSQTNNDMPAPSVRNVSVVNSYIYNDCSTKVGMLIGQIYASDKVEVTEVRIENIYCQGYIHSTADGEKDVNIGGICGVTNLWSKSPSKLVFRSVVSDVDVTATTTEKSIFGGGIVAFNQNTHSTDPAKTKSAIHEVYENCANLGNLDFGCKKAVAGGIYGNTSKHGTITITNCVNAGIVKGQKVGAAIGAMVMTKNAEGSSVTVDHFINLGDIQYFSESYKSSGAIYGGTTWEPKVTGYFEQCYSVPVEHLQSATQYTKKILTGSDILAILAEKEFDVDGWMFVEGIGPVPKTVGVVCGYAQYNTYRLAAVQTSPTGNGVMKVRLSGAVDTLKYKTVGFKVKVNDGTETDMKTSIASRVIAYDENNTTKTVDAYTGFFTPYVYFGELENIPMTGTVTITVTPYVVDLKGGLTEADTYTVIFEEGVLKKATSNSGGLTLKNDNAGGYSKPEGTN